MVSPLVIDEGIDGDTAIAIKFGRFDPGMLGEAVTIGLISLNMPMVKTALSKPFFGGAGRKSRRWPHHPDSVASVPGVVRGRAVIEAVVGQEVRVGWGLRRGEGCEAQDHRLLHL